MNAAATNPEVPLDRAVPTTCACRWARRSARRTFARRWRAASCGFVHSFTTGSAVDGPGVRVVAWLAGCQFRCVYCHNPDTWKMTNGMPVTLARAVEQIQKYRHGLQTMKGGLTISGGEPLMQHRFVLKVFAAAKKMGVHTALDTQRLSRRPAQRCGPRLH